MKNIEDEKYKKVTINDSILDLSSEKYQKITIYSDFTNMGADYAVIDYEKDNEVFQKEIPGAAIKFALAEFEVQKGKKIAYGKDVEVKNVNDVIEEKKRNK